MLRTLAITSNQFVLSFGVLIAFLSSKQYEIEESYLESMAKQWKAEKSAMKYSWWQSCQPLLEHFLESNLFILYVVSKLRKSSIQCFKQCAIRSWNEGVTAVGSRTPQAERLISQPCEISLLLQSDFVALFVRLRNLADLVFTCEMVLSASRYLRPTLWDIFLQIFVV